MASVSLRGVTKKFESVEVLTGIDLEIADGEFVALVGESGCGKSTLLRLLAGLDWVSGGEISIGSRVVNNVPPRDRDVAMVFQSYALYPHLSVAQNLGFPLSLRNTEPSAREGRIANVAASLSLGRFLQRRPRALSGGQRQRVAMGRAMIRSPKVFLFDEPLSNLDAKMRLQMRAELKALHQQLATTSVYVTHDQVEAMTLADRIVVMDQGRVQQVGAPLDVYDRPGNKFVAGFIGSPAMNFVQGEVTASGVTVADTQIAVPLGQLPEQGRKVWLGVRPEHLVIDPSGVSAKIEVVEPLGHGTMLHVTAFGVRWVVLDSGRSMVRAGDQLGLRIDPQRMHLFDYETGIRLG
jgi:multiple sugar transport system ATP-binding protein